MHIPFSMEPKSPKCMGVFCTEKCEATRFRHNSTYNHVDAINTLFTASLSDAPSAGGTPDHGTSRVHRPPVTTKSSSFSIHELVEAEWDDLELTTAGYMEQR
jgi:hypothetical protein